MKFVFEMCVMLPSIMLSVVYDVDGVKKLPLLGTGSGVEAGRLQREPLATFRIISSALQEVIHLLAVRFLRFTLLNIVRVKIVNAYAVVQFYQTYFNFIFLCYKLIIKP